VSAQASPNPSASVELIAAAIGEGAQHMGCKAGPAALRAHGVAQALTRAGRVADWGAHVESDAMLLDGTPAGQLRVVQDFSPRLAAATKNAIDEGRFPLVIGGDHSCAVGTWSGIADAHRLRGELGLIWIDAHLDSHTPDTSPSGAPHGMPLAALLGHGPAALTDIGGWRGKFKAGNVVVIGARSYEAGEAALLTRLGVRVIAMDEVARRGFAACMSEAIAIVTSNTSAYGMTFDIDAIDPQDAPGVGSPEAGGIPLQAAIDGLRIVAGDPRLIGFELVEYNPAFDDAARSTAAACEALICAAVSTPVHRRLAA
jgi:arginase